MLLSANGLALLVFGILPQPLMASAAWRSRRSVMAKHRTSPSTSSPAGLVYDGELLKVHRDQVRLPDGAEAGREYIRHPGAVAIVRAVRRRRGPARAPVPLSRTGATSSSCPRASSSPARPQLATAKRELIEETGYEAQEWTRLGVIHTAIGYTDEAIELFLAREADAEGAASSTQGEFLEVFSLPFGEAIDMIRDGRITDAKTVSGLLWADKWVARSG